MSGDLVEKTKSTAALYFDGWEEERPYALWSSFDKERAVDFSIFITGKLYAREKVPHNVRQLAAVAALTALERTEELKLHIHAALNVGCSPEELTEIIFQTATYAGMPVVNSALKAFRDVLQKRGMWPLDE